MTIPVSKMIYIIEKVVMLTLPLANHFRLSPGLSGVSMVLESKPTEFSSANLENPPTSVVPSYSCIVRGFIFNNILLKK